MVLYDRPTPLFRAYRVEPKSEELLQREVPLKSGGALVIDQTEGSGCHRCELEAFRSAKDAETNAYSTNCEAIDEIARQLRLRDLGGVVVLDLIDMRLQKQRREIRDRLEKAMEHDRAKKTIGEIDRFGLLFDPTACGRALTKNISVNATSATVEAVSATATAWAARTFARPLPAFA